MHQQKSPTNYAVTSAAPTKKKQYYYLSFMIYIGSKGLM